MNFLRNDHDTRVHEDRVGYGLSFHGGQGSAVLDDYLTRVGNNHYTEIAALVRGEHGAWVIVGASLSADYPRFRVLLQQVVSTFAVS